MSFYAIYTEGGELMHIILASIATIVGRKGEGDTLVKHKCKQFFHSGKRLIPAPKYAVHIGYDRFDLDAQGRMSSR